MSKQKGIDISYWQGDIDFKKIKMNEDVKFVILREGYRQTMDKQFLNYVFGCRTWGIPIVGVYHFVYLLNDRYTSNSETGRLNAESCLRNIQNAQLRKDEIIVWCDLEYDTVTHAKRTHNVDLTSQDIREITTAFCNEILKSGYRVGIYTNLDYARNKYGLDFIKNFDVWLADYSGEADLNCSYHQYTSDGQVEGISGKVDMNWKYDTTNKEESQMGVSVQNVLNVARSWIGKNEADGSHRYIIDLYNSVKPLPRGYACAIQTSGARHSFRLSQSRLAQRILSLANADVRSRLNCVRAWESGLKMATSHQGQATSFSTTGMITASQTTDTQTM